MSFKQALSRYTAPQIVAALGCPRGTAYDWLDGRRAPPEWQQPHWLALLAQRIGAHAPTRSPRPKRTTSAKRAHGKP